VRGPRQGRSWGAPEQRGGTAHGARRPARRGTQAARRRRAARAAAPASTGSGRPGRRGARPPAPPPQGGGHAFIGYHLAKQLIAKGHDVTIFNDGDKVRCGG
jgi:hypothetical protein